DDCRNIVVAADQPAPGRIFSDPTQRTPIVVQPVFAQIIDGEIGAEIVGEVIADAATTTETTMAEARNRQIIDRLAGIVADVAAQIPSRADLDRHIFGRFLDI